MKLNMKLIRRKNGVYYAVWRGEDGKQHWKSFRTKDRTIARRLFNQFERMYLQGKLVQLENRARYIRLSEFGEEYFAWLEKAREPTTCKLYRDAWKKLMAVVGDILLPDVTRKHVDMYVQSELTKGNKPVTVNKDLRGLKAIFNKAVEWGYIRKNPFTGYKMLKVDKKPPRALTKEEIIRLFSVIDDEYFRLFVAFALYSGCRRNEILYLTWDRVDLENRVIYIEKTKSHHSRYVPISSSLMIVLQKLKTYSQVGKLFPKWTPDWATHKFKEYARKAGIDCRLHDLRHTFATHLVVGGVPLRVLQELLGHQCLTSTLVYAHAMEEYKREAVEKFRAGLEFVK